MIEKSNVCNNADMRGHSISDQSSKKCQSIELLRYLDQFVKQISIRKSNNSGLQQQLASLSKAYNQAQQRLLQTQKALMAQTLLLQKQRSIIQIYKYILNQSMQDQTIITFIQHLQEETDKKNQILDELNQIKAIINKKKVKRYKRVNDEDKNIKQLKRQVSRLHEQKIYDEQNSQIVNNQNYELNLKNQELQNEVKCIQLQNEELRKKLSEKQKNIDQINQKMTQNERNQYQSSIYLKKLNEENIRIKKKQQKLIILQKQSQALDRLFKQKLNIEFSHSQKQNKGLNNSQQSQDKFNFSYEQVSQKMKNVEQKINKLLKYRQMYKKQKQNKLINDFLLLQISILKLFLSDEALKLIKQLEEQKMQCLQNQLRNLAVLEKNRFYKLQQSQKQIWKYKIKALKDEQQQFITNNSWAKNLSYLRSKNQMISPKQVSGILQNMNFFGQQSKQKSEALEKASQDTSQFNQ